MTAKLAARLFRGGAREVCPEIPRNWGRLSAPFAELPRHFLNTRSTRSIICEMSFFACAAEKNAASSCDGGR